MKDKRAESIRDIDLSDLRLPIIVIYRHPKDYPDKYAARIFDLIRPTDTVIVKDSLQELQRDISQSEVRGFIVRDEKDDPCIVGCWI